MNTVLIGSIDTLLGEHLKDNYSSYTVLVDENTRRDCYPLIKDSLPVHSVMEINSGEENKNLTTCVDIWTYLTTNEVDRSAILINLGGGVIGDMGGFSASCYKRGIDFINIPTTLLAQVDASVGGKLGIDFNGYKNHIGLFTEPEAVLIDPIFLETLPHKELLSGFAEIIKHGLIADRSYWNKAKSLPITPENAGLLIHESVEIKKNVVSSDFKEAGKRKLLNFGHTIGHAIESFFMESPDHERLLHGEAIAIGMIAEAWLSMKYGSLSGEELKEISTYLLALYGKVVIEEKYFDEIMGRMSQDKKNKDNKLLFTLLEQIGVGIWDVDVTYEDAEKAIQYYIAL